MSLLLVGNFIEPLIYGEINILLFVAHFETGFYGLKLQGFNQFKTRIKWQMIRKHSPRLAM